MSVRQLWEGCDAAVWARKLDGRTKLLILFLVAVLAIVVDNPRTLFLLFTATLLLHLSARTSIYKWQVLAILLLLGLWGSMFSQALFFAQTPRTPLFVIIEPTMPVLGQITGGLYIYREGVIYGAVQGLRSAMMLSLGLFVCWTSDPRQLLKALITWRLSPQIAFMLVTAIRFLPVLAAEAGELLSLYVYVLIQELAAKVLSGIYLILPNHYWLAVLEELRLWHFLLSAEGSFWLQRGKMSFGTPKKNLSVAY